MKGMLILFIHYSFFCRLSQIHEIDIGKDYCYNQAYYRPNHATHHLLDDKHAYDDDDKTCYVISEVTHISFYLNTAINCAGIGVSNSIGLPVTG